MRKNLLKKMGVCLTVVAMMTAATACNTKIKVDYGFNAADYVELGQYKGIEAVVDEASIEKSLIEKKIQNDVDSKTVYTEVSREAKEFDQVTVDYTASIGGQTVSGFSNEGDELILGKDTFTVEGFVEALYGMKAGQTKVVTLTVPENFTDAEEYAGRKIVFDITMKKVAQPAIPMITDAYVKEAFGYDTVEAYRQSVKDELQEEIDKQTEEARKEAVLTKLQENCTIKGYPEDYLETKKQEYDKSISFYSLMQDMSNDEYCQKTFGISFDEYVKRAVAQEMILLTIVQEEKLEMTEYQYKGELGTFAEQRGYTNKDTFVEKYGKDTIVKNMLLQKAQDIVMENAVFQ